MSGPRVLGDYVSGPSVKRMLSPPFSLIHKATYIMMQPHEMRSGNRYAQQAQARRTLGDLIASRSALVAICQRCKHRRLLFPAVLANHLGELSWSSTCRSTCAAANVCESSR